MFREDWSKWKDRGFVGRYVNVIAHDPLTAAGFPKVWRSDGWNLLDTTTIIVTAQVFAGRLRGNPPSEAMITVVLMCHWITLLGISRLITKAQASFVSMLTRMIPVWSTMFDA